MGFLVFRCNCNHGIFCCLALQRSGLVVSDRRELVVRSFESMSALIDFIPNSLLCFTREHITG